MSDTLISSLLAAGSGLLVVLIGQAIVPFIREWAARGRDAQYLAIRVVTLLDKFVEDCASTALDSGQPNREGVSEPQVDAPKPPVYPSDVNWKSIDRTLMYLLLAVPAATERAANVVAATGENDSPPDFSDFGTVSDHPAHLFKRRSRQQLDGYEDRPDTDQIKRWAQTVDGA
jgi:hypothetical protein